MLPPPRSGTLPLPSNGCHMATLMYLVMGCRVRNGRHGRRQGRNRCFAFPMALRRCREDGAAHGPVNQRFLAQLAHLSGGVSKSARDLGLYGAHVMTNPIKMYTLYNTLYNTITNTLLDAHPSTHVHLHLRRATTCHDIPSSCWRPMYSHLCELGWGV
jgi:hypothetical protein